MKRILLFACGLVLATVLPVDGAEVIINEIMYHPAPGVPENTRQEWVELFNKGNQTADLSGWTFSKGISFTFSNVAIPPSGYLIVAADAASFVSRYPTVTNVVGNWTGRLANSGEEIELKNATGETVDSVTYATEGDWAERRRGPLVSGHYGWIWFSGADGAGRSIELVNPNLPNTYGQNWTNSAPSQGTPGRPNASLLTNTAPLIVDAIHKPAVPKSTDPVTITARVIDEMSTGVVVTLLYRVDANPQTNSFASMPMSDDGGHGDGVAGDGIYGATLGPRPDGTVVEFYVQARDGAGQARTWPAPARQVNLTYAQTCNMLYQVDDEVYAGKQPVCRLIMTEIERAELASSTIRQTDAQMNITLVTVDGTSTKVRYNAGVRIRGAGTRGANNPVPNLRVNIPDDRLWNDVSEINLNAFFPHAQVVGSALVQKSGLVAANGRAVQVRINGDNWASATLPQFSSYVLMEVIDSDWAGNHLPDDPDGNVYRGSTGNHSATLNYLGTNSASYVAAGYSKTSNGSEDNWTDLFNLTFALSSTTNDAAYVAGVRQVADVEEWMRYFAAFTMLASMETSLATGRGDDYAMYRGIVDPRFLLLPHDLDTILGQGDTAGDPTINIFRMVPEVNGNANTVVFNRFMRHPEFVPFYYRELKRLADTTFSPAELNPLLDRLLGDFVPPQTIDAMKNFAATRRSYVLSQIPLTLTVNHTLPITNGFPRTTNAAVSLNGFANAIDTRAVRVNGNVANWTAWLGTWNAAAVMMQPGINRVLVQAFDGASNELARMTVDIWYDDGTVQNTGGAITTNTVWTAANGPYLLGASVTVGNGATLTIQAGATVYLGNGVNLSVANGGRLLAEGTDTQHIRFTRAPGTAVSWGGITVSGSASSPETRITYTDFEFNGATAVHAVDGTVFLDHLTFGNRSVQYVSLDRSSFIVQECVFPTATSPFELVHGTGGIKAGGRGIFTRNFFGRAMGYNDVVDFTGGNRPGPIVQFINNVFIGSDDDLLDLDSTDAWVEGNIFLHAHRNGSPDSSSAVSGGADNADTSEVTIIGNIIYDCDHAALAKQGNFFTLINNTIVHQTRVGGVDTDAAVVILADEGTVEGAGFYLEGNIIYDAEKLVRLQTASPVTFTNNIIYPALQYADSAILRYSNNISVDPLLAYIPQLSETTNFSSWAGAQVIWKWFGLQPASPAAGTGPNARDKGGVIPLGVSISGEPVGTNRATSATLRVGLARDGNGIPGVGWPSGSGYTHYQWRLDGGSWNGPVPINTAISLSNLVNGPHYVEVSGRRDSAFFQDDPAFGLSAVVTRSGTWFVDTNFAGALRINEILARNNSAVLIGGEYPDLVELFNGGTVAIDLAGFGITDEPTNRFKFVFPPGTSLAPGDYLVLLADSENGPGVHLGFGLNQMGDQLFLYGPDGQLVDSVTFGLQIADYSLARMKDRTWGLGVPTLGGANVAQPLGSADSLLINEWLAAGETLFFEDFVELYNASDLPVSIGGLFLSDAPQGTPNRSPISPLSFIAARGFSAFIADGQPEDGPEHLAFKLSPEQGQIGLFTADLKLIDCIWYGPQANDLSEGRKPSGSSVFAFFTQPTPGSANPGEGTTVNVTNLTINLLAMTERWRFESSGTDLGTGWRASSFDDSAWPSGLALLHNENNATIPNRNTLIPLTSPPQSTLYFRTKFVVNTNLAGFSLRASVYLDDGAVVYLNGAELSRIRIAGGSVSYSTLATNTPPGGDAFLETLMLPIGALLPGTNVVAVEVHQQSPTSADFVWGMALDAIRPITNITSVAPLVNEVMANNRSFTNANGSVTDWVELCNPLPNPYNLGGTSLSDDPGLPQRWVFPNGVSIAPGGYLVVLFDPDAAPSTNFVLGTALNTGFGLKASGDDVYFFDTPGRGAALLDSISFGIQTADFSVGRQLNANSWTLNLPTAGSQNIVAGLGNPANLRVNEWMASPAPGEDDWFEIFNPNNQPVALGGLYLSDDLNDPDKFEIPPLSFISRSTNGFVQFFADNNPQNGRDHVGFRLSATRESIGIFAADGVMIDGISYEQQDPGVSEGRLPDGGSTIVKFETTQTPAESNFLPLNDIVINEALTHSDLPFEDAIELHNMGAESAYVGGWYLSDNNEQLRKFRIPDGTVIPAHSFVVFYENQFNPEPGFFPGFALSSANGDQIYLAATDGSGNLTGYRAVARFGAAESRVSFGRYETSIGSDFTAMSQRTFGVDAPTTIQQFRTGVGLSNSYPKIGPIVINEIMYHPIDAGEEDSALGEFVELRNISASPVPLFDPDHPTNTWRLRDAVDLEFATNVTIPAGGYLLAVSFNPATNGAALAGFLAKYGLPPTVPIVGPYRGKLDNNGESVELVKPGDIQLDGAVARVLVDKVRYSDSAPWPTAGDTGTNSVSLQRRNSAEYGNDPVNWVAGAPTPAASNGSALLTPPAIEMQPAGQLVLVGDSVTFSATVSGGLPIEYQWRLNGLDIPGATEPSLVLNDVQFGNAGEYTLRVSNPAGAALSQKARLAIRLAPTITRQPQDRIVAAGGMAVFSVAVRGTLPLSYQWRFHGTNLPGAVSHKLLLTNVQPAHIGDYSVIVGNDYGAVTSTVAALTIGDVPAIVIPPDSQTVLAGVTVSFNVTVTGTAPLSYQWSFNGVMLSEATGPALILPNVQPTNTGSYIVVISNAVGRAISQAAILTVVIPPNVSITAADPAAAEAVADPGTFVLTRVGSTNFPLSVNFSVGGNAGNGSDYSAINSPLTIPAGVTSATLNVLPVNDSTREGTEAVILTLNGGDGYFVGSPSSAAVLITDDDNLPPSVNVISPTNGSLYFLTPTNISVEVDAVDLDGAISKVEFYNHGTNRLGQSVLSPFRFTWTNVTVGTNSLTAVATDDLGTPTTSAPVVFYVNIPPVVSIISPVNGATFVPGTNIAITATAADSDGAVERVEFSVGGTLIGSDSTPPYSAIVSNVDIGAYVITARAIDNRGMTASSSSINVRVKVSTSDFTDMFEERGDIAGFVHTIAGNSFGATREPFEPPAYADGTRSVWLRWTAPENGICVMDTFGSLFDTVLAVFTNDPPAIQSISNLTLVAENDDFEGLASRVTFNATEGTVYQIRVEGFGASLGGNIVFHLYHVTDAPRIFIQPEDQVVARGGRATFTFAPAATTSYTTQWRFEGTPILGATDVSLIVSNVQPANEGEYTVVVSNAFGSDVSRGARLTIGIRPTMTLQPQPLTVVEGSAAAFTAGASGTAPMTFRWRRGTGFLTNGTFTVNQGTNTLTLSDVRTNDAGNYSVVITNAVGTIISGGALLTVLRDQDGDRMPDVWESANGLNPLEAADAALDSDHDGASNLDEYLCGTDPASAASHLGISISTAGGSVILGFPATSNKTYSVMFQDFAPGPGWLKLGNVSAVTSNRSVTFTDPMPGNGRIYRVRTPQVP